MRWKGRRQSGNVEDRRSMRTPAMAGGGVIGLIVIVVVMFLGGDPRPLLREMQKQQPQQPGQVGVQLDPAQDEAAAFVSVVLADTEEVWTKLLRDAGREYRIPTLVLFRDQVDSACGFQSAATGPFYCPLDEKAYIDLSFFDQLHQQLGAPGDFARAYVIAHEIGHHVQKVLGTSDEVHRLQRGASREEANRLSVRLELQADFYAGVWAHHAEQNWKILEPGDVNEALQAATAIGDDRLQKQSQGVVVPESFTHGTSQQRMRWFSEGLKTGDIRRGDTFSIRYEDL